MLDEQYTFEFDPNVKTFEFDSIGPKGKIRKLVRYSETSSHNFYNLGFDDHRAAIRRLESRLGRMVEADLIIEIL